jgi:hypothetical protein
MVACAEEQFQHHRLKSGKTAANLDGGIYPWVGRIKSISKFMTQDFPYQIFPEYGSSRQWLNFPSKQ